MRQAIITKFISPTDTKGARVKATAEAGSITLGWDHSKNGEQNHEAAARALMAKFGWDKFNKIVGGGTKDGYVFVQIE